MSAALAYGLRRWRDLLFQKPQGLLLGHAALAEEVVLEEGQVGLSCLVALHRREEELVVDWERGGGRSNLER